MPPPNMRTILAQVYQKSLSMQSRGNFSLPAGGKGPKKKTVVSFLGFTVGLIIGYHLSVERGL